MFRLACRRVKRAGGRTLTQRDWMAVLHGKEGQRYHAMNRELQRKYRNTAHGKAVLRRAQRRYWATPAGREAKRRTNRRHMRRKREQLKKAAANADS